jgi:hypothetical protein
MVSYCFDTDEPAGSIFEGDMAEWKLRRDLTDFPNARDPRLPYVFDLYWDIKHKSELEHILRQGTHADIDEIRLLVAEHGLSVDEALVTTKAIRR